MTEQPLTVEMPTLETVEVDMLPAESVVMEDATFETPMVEPVAEFAPPVAEVAPPVAQFAPLAPSPVAPAPFAMEPPVVQEETVTEQPLTVECPRSRRWKWICCPPSR